METPKTVLLTRLVSKKLITQVNYRKLSPLIL